MVNVSGPDNIGQFSLGSGHPCLPDLKTELLSGKKVGDMTCKAHLDGYNQLDYWTGKNDKSARREFFYYDETDLMALRVEGCSPE